MIFHRRDSHLLICVGFLLFFSFQYIVFQISDPSPASHYLRDQLVNNKVVKYSKKSIHAIDTKPFDFIRHSHHHSPQQQHDESTTVQPIRVAMLIVYQGKSLPLWMETLSLTLQLSNSFIDWIIIVTDSHVFPSSNNIKFIHIEETELYTRLTTTLDDNLHGDTTTIQTLFNVWPYAFAEFKPCLGTLFSDYIQNYTHWGYADIDQLFSKLDYIIPAQLLNSYDIYTASFGDNFRLYMRGQFVIFKNNAVVNNIWRNCSTYSKLAKRLRYFVQGGSKHWYFESAEGCISKAVIDYNTAAGSGSSLKIYFASTQISDAIQATKLSDQESIFLSNTLIRCYEHPLPKLTSTVISQLNTLPQYQRIDSSLFSSSSHEHEHRPKRQKAQRHVYNCEYWVNPAFQVCLNTSVPAYADVVSINGVISYSSVDHYRLAAATSHTSISNSIDNISVIINSASVSNNSGGNGSSCRRAGMSHFQGWKKNYYAYTARRPPIDSHALIITQSGFIPLRVSSVGERRSGSNGNRDGSNGINDKEDEDKSNDGVYLKPFSETLYASNSNTNNIAFATNHELSLSSLTTAIGIRQHCAKFSHDLKSCVCPVTALTNNQNDISSINNQIRVTQGQLPSSHLKATSTESETGENAKDSIDITVKQQPRVTLIMTYSYHSLSQSPSNISLLIQSLESWELGPIILVLGLNDNVDSNGEKSDNSHENNNAKLDSIIAQLSSDVTLVIVDTSCATKQPQQDIDLFLLMNIGLEISTAATTTTNTTAGLVALVVAPNTSIDKNNQLLALLSFQHQDVLMNQIQQHVVMSAPFTVVALTVPIISNTTTAIAVNSTLSSSLSQLLLIVFNQSASVHGSGWLQFPEELSSSVGSIGSVDVGDDVVYEVIRGCGYTIHELDYEVNSNSSNSVMATSRTMMSTREFGRNSNNNSNNNNKNYNLTDVEILLIKKSQSTFKKQLKKYFIRSAELRSSPHSTDGGNNNDIYSVYSSQPFGTEFLKEQAQLLKEGEEEEEIKKKKNKKSDGG